MERPRHQPTEKEARVVKEPANVVTRNVRLVREAALIISYPKLDFPPVPPVQHPLSFLVLPPRSQLPAYSGLSTSYEAGIASGAAIFEDRRVYVRACNRRSSWNNLWKGLDMVVTRIEVHVCWSVREIFFRVK